MPWLEVTDNIGLLRDLVAGNGHKLPASANID